MRLRRVAAARLGGCTWSRLARIGTTAGVALRRGLSQGRHQARGLLLVFNRHAPCLLGVLARGRWRVSQRRAIRRFGRSAARLDCFDHVERLVLAHDDVVAAWINGVPRFHGDPAVAFRAHDLQSAHDAPAVKVPVVQPVLRQPVGLLVIEI